MNDGDRGDDVSKGEVSFRRRRRTRRGKRALRVPVDEVPRRRASDLPPGADAQTGTDPTEQETPSDAPSNGAEERSRRSSSQPPTSSSYPPPSGEGVVMSGTVRISEHPPPPDEPEPEAEDDAVGDEPEVSVEDADPEELEAAAAEDAEPSQRTWTSEDGGDSHDTLPGTPLEASEDEDESQTEWLDDADTAVRQDRRDSAQELEAAELEIEEVEEGDEEALELEEVAGEPPPVPGDVVAGSEESSEAPSPEEPAEAEAEPEEEGEAQFEDDSASEQSETRKARPWFEEFFNDDYLRTVPQPPDHWIQRQCDFIEQTLGLEKGATILDVGCGLGLHAVELASRGYLIVGLDLSLPMLSRAADEAQDRGLKMNFLHADMREMSFDGAFDAILCWGTTFGYFDDETNREVIERLYRALKPMGLLLLDVVNRDHVVPSQPNLVWFEGDGCVCMEETNFNFITSRLEVKRTVILDDGRQRESHYSIRLYSLHELGQLLHQKGFRVAQVSGMEATPGVFFGQDSPRMIILAERRLTNQDGSPPPAESFSGEEGKDRLDSDDD